jgi:hemerythrin-like domain-containing protein
MDDVNHGLLGRPAPRPRRHHHAQEQASPTAITQVQMRTEDEHAVVGEPLAPHDPLAALFRFHGEIRTALNLLEGLADEPADARWAREHRQRAQKLLHFLSGPLIWHDIDEECSLLPRLSHRVYAEEHELDDALQAIRRDHAVMERRLEPVLVHLSGLAAGRHPEKSFASDVEKLRDHLLPHLASEERDLFPFARLVLTERHLQEMGEELEARAAARAEG